MGQQETLRDEGKATPDFDPLIHGLWTRFVDSGRINHGAWLRAVAAGDFVGTCRACGDYLVPGQAEERGRRTDYEATCRSVTCAKTMLAPGGKLVERSSRRSEQPTNWGP